MDNLSTSIFHAVDDLSKATQSRTGPEDAEKFLLMRKRKVWASFMKEYSRVESYLI